MLSPAADTIVAVSSPAGRSLRGLIRISGGQTRAILEQLLVDEPAAPQRLPAPRQLARARLRFGAAGTLPIFISIFAGPASYTGQDMAEVQLPGNPALLERLLSRLVALGARLAQPGEFTFRAFLAGKLDLTQAEGIAATISAVSSAQLQAAALLRQGRLGELARRLTDDLAHSLALVEAGIDFVDQEDVHPIAPADLDERLAHLVGELADILRRSQSWRQLEGLPRVVLLGRPSAGKSTLFNALLGRQRAVTAAMPGTTRDVLAEPLTLPGPAGGQVEVLLQDLAGLDQPRTALDEQVQQQARAAIAHADLILALEDGDDPAATQILLPPPAELRPPVLRIRSKSDLLAAGALPPAGFDVLISARTGRGLDQLRQALSQRLAGQLLSFSGEILTLQDRHQAALRAAADYLAQARQLLERQRLAVALQQAELIASSLRSALNELAALAGEMTPDEVLGRIFATFCIGK